MANVLEDGDKIVLSALDARVSLSLLRGLMNAYEIARQCEKDAGDASGTLSYAGVKYSIKSLERLHMVQAVANSYRDNKPRQNYKITQLGRQVLEWHMNGLSRMLKLAHDRKI